MSLEDAWHASLHWPFSYSSSAFCALATEGPLTCPNNQTWTRGPDDIEACLVFFSTFEELRPRLGGLSVSETEDRREAVVRAGAKRSQETRRRREARRRGDE